VGVGLIGGSVGLALREAGLAKTVVGIGRRASSLRKARACGAVTTTTTRLDRGVADAELIVVCSPVDRIVEHVVAAAGHCPEGALITDAGSIKGRILEGLDQRLPDGFPRGVDFVGAHPMAGSEKTGPEFARADLFAGRVCLVTPGESAPRRAVRGVTDFWESLGARVIRMSPAEHDSVVATVSHLPHIAAAALADLASRPQLEAVGPGWLDTTRIAAGDVELWQQILSGNRVAVLKALDEFEKLLASYRAALATDNARELTDLLRAGRDKRRAGERLGRGNA
jgi:prephenate dehydrogenase